MANRLADQSSPYLRQHADDHGDVPLPETVKRAPRGHTSGPRPLHVPAHWYDLVDDPTPPVGADIEVSGG